MAAPLADRIRPKTIDEMVGQTHLLSPGKPLRRLIGSGQIPNMIFYGPPGTGKTTLATIIAGQSKKTLHKLNGTTASTADIKNIISNLDTFHAPGGILLYLDEIQYLNKKQQQTLLEFMENGKITLIASTTENPYFYIYGALLSRCVVFEFKPVCEKEVQKAVKRAFSILEEGGSPFSISDEVIPMLSRSCSGDVRKAIGSAELCALCAEEKNGVRLITADMVKELVSFGASRYDKSGDEHYDLLSAFQKSMRGSDPDAAVYYLARLLQSGDLSSVCRRLMVCACEDVGLAYPQLLPIVKACVDIAFQVGLPEARIPLSDAVILVCLSPKSNSSYLAIDQAIRDVESGKLYPFPRHLQNKHFDGNDAQTKGQHYLYPHDYENAWVDQSYLPDHLKGAKYYQFGQNKTEQAYFSYWKKIRNQSARKKDC